MCSVAGGGGGGGGAGVGEGGLVVVIWGWLEVLASALVGRMASLEGVVFLEVDDEEAAVVSSWVGGEVLLAAVAVAVVSSGLVDAMVSELEELVVFFCSSEEDIISSWSLS